MTHSLFFALSDHVRGEILGRLDSGRITVSKLAAPIYVFHTPDPKLLLADLVGEHSAGKRAASGVSGQRWVS